MCGFTILSRMLFSTSSGWELRLAVAMLILAAELAVLGTRPSISATITIITSIQDAIGKAPTWSSGLTTNVKIILTKTVFKARFGILRIIRIQCNGATVRYVLYLLVLPCVRYPNQESSLGEARSCDPNSLLLTSDHLHLHLHLHSH